MPDRPDLYGAIRNDQAAKHAAHDAATAPERQAHEQQLEADAATYGTPAWDALPASRRSIVQQRALANARTAAGGSDAA
ncbi:hypothetical protein [Streptomyces chryseus]